MPDRSTAQCRRLPGLGALCAALPLALAGCSLTSLLTGPHEAASTSATVSTVSFHGWQSCYRLSNGLVSVTNVPQVGGRTLEYSLDSCNFLFLGRKELGTTLEDPGSSRYRSFGGHFAQLHPEARWRDSQSRAFMAPYEAKVVSAEGPVAAVEMTGPPDLATGTRITRRIELFAGSTHLRLTDTLASIRFVPQEWGLHDLLELKGYPTPSGVLRGSEKPAGDLSLYVPLNPRSRFPGGVQAFLSQDRPAGSADDQWSTSRLPGLLTLRYRREFSKVTVDPVLPWIAFADRRSGTIFVQSCQAPEKAILTTGLAIDSYPFIELQCYAPVVRLDPGKTTSLVQDWYSARCPGPVVDVTDAGAVSEPLSLLRGGGRTWVAGTFGVFYVGEASIVFRNAEGAELARLGCGPVDPRHVFELDRTVALPPGTAELALEVRDPAGKTLGHLGRILLGTTR